MKKILFIVVVLILSCTINLIAQTITTWNGTVSNDWHDPGNWNNGVPDQTMNAVIPNSSSYARHPVVSSDAPCASLANEGTLRVENGASLNVQDNYYGGLEENLNLLNGNVNVGGTMQVQGMVRVSDDSAAGTSSINCGNYSANANSLTKINNNGELNCTDFNAASSSQTDLNAGGSLSATNLNDNGTIFQNSGSLVCNNFEINNGGQLNQSGGNFSATSTGLISENSSANLSGNASFDYSGDVTCDGTVQVSGNAIIWTSGSGSPVFYGGPNSTINLYGGYFSVLDFSTSGTVNISGGNAFVQNTVHNGTTNLYAGELNVYGNLNNNGTINQSGGTSEIHSGNPADTFTNNGNFNQTGGTSQINNLRNSGGLYNSTGACTISIAVNDDGGTWDNNGADQFIDELDNNGTFTQSNGSTSVSGSFNNSGLFYNHTAQCTVSIEVVNDPTAVWENHGGTQSLGNVTNQGTFEQSSGTTDVPGTLLNDTSGSTSISGGTLLLGNGTFNGTLNQSGGTIDVQNDLIFGDLSSNTQSGGTLNALGDVEFNQSIVNTGPNGEFVFNGGGIQQITNPSALPNTNMLPTVVVENGSMVSFDEKTSFAVKKLEVNNATLKVNSGILECYDPPTGELVLGPNGTLEFGGTNTLPEFGTNTFDSSSKVIYNSIIDDQPVAEATYQKVGFYNGRKVLSGNASVAQELTLNSIVDIGNYDLTLLSDATLSQSLNSFVATTGSGYLKKENVSSGDFPIGPDLSNYNGFSFDNNGVALNSIGARVETGINPTHPNDAYCLQRTWDIIKDGVLNADFTFQWLQTQETQPFEQARTNNRIIGHLCHTPPSWQVITSPSGATGTGTLSDPYEFDVGNVVLVSGFCLGDGDHTLPVTLSSFNAVYSNDAGLEFIQVNWTTSTETDVHGFNVYKSETDVFDDAYMINPSLIYGQGTTTTGYSYSFDDLDANTEARNYYWIEQLDYSGLSELFGPAVYIPDGNNDPGNQIYLESKVLQHYPNPVENNLKINYHIKGNATEQNAVFYIYNMKGEFIEPVFGYNGTTEIDLTRYAPGVYFYRLQNTSLGEIYKFVVIL